VRTLRTAHGSKVRGILSFTALLRLYDPDVVHLTLPWPRSAGDLRAACALTAVPTVLVHQLVPSAAELQIRRRWFYSWTRSRRQTWVAVSEYGRRMLAQAFAVSDTVTIPVVYNAPSVGANGAKSPSIEDRRVFGLEPEDHVVVSVGRLSQEKGHDVLIEAASALRSRLPRLRMLIAGTGSLDTALREAIIERGLEQHVRLVGQLDSVGSLLSIADVFVLPSRREGTPFALLEAMSHGLPVIATRFGGADEIIEPGTNGVLVPIDDPGQLAVAVEDTVNDPAAARAMGERGRRTLSRFSEDQMFTQTLELLEAAAGRRQSA
jgi:glycosyltransferase involved in cell wall biosynthesis